MSSRRLLQHKELDKQPTRPNSTQYNSTATHWSRHSIIFPQLVFPISLSLFNQLTASIAAKGAFFLLFCGLWPMTLPSELEQACQISTSKLTSVKSYCPDTQTRPTAWQGPLKWLITFISSNSNINCHPTSTRTFTQITATCKKKTINCHSVKLQFHRYQVKYQLPSPRLRHIFKQSNFTFHTYLTDQENVLASSYHKKSFCKWVLSVTLN